MCSDSGRLFRKCSQCGRPVSLLVQVGEAESDAAVLQRSDRRVGNFNLIPEGDYVAEFIAVTVVAFIVVEIADELDFVALSDLDQVLCFHTGFGTGIDDLGTGDIAVRILRIEIQQQVDPGAVQDGRNIPGDQVVIAVLNGVQVVICDRLAVNRQPGSVKLTCKGISVDGEVVVGSEVDKSGSVVKEYIPGQADNEVPLALGKLNSAVVPDKLSCVKMVFKNVFSCAFRSQAASGEQVEEGSGTSG